MNNDIGYSLGIDTSNYTTSVAVIDNSYNIIADERIILEVANGKRGLRQSDAFFKHINNIPLLFDKIFSNIDSHLIKIIAASSRPRPVDNSYMPVFTSGQAMAKSISALLNSQYYEFSHQEGHIKAASFLNDFDKISEFIVLHISGGTSEVLKVKNNYQGYEINIIGGSKDISIGQLIDRVGVKLGYPFPSGRYLDEIACDFHGENNNLFKGIHISDTNINLSGIETQCYKYIEKQIDENILIHELFKKISEALILIIKNTVAMSGINNVLLVGGVSSSTFIKIYLDKKLKNQGIKIDFGPSKYCTDNAVGIAVLGMEKLLIDNR